MSIYCLKPSSLKGLVKRVGVPIALFAGFFLGAMPAIAGVGIGVTPTVPASVVPIQLALPASVQIVWQNTTGNNNNLHANVISGVVITPACGEFTAPCPAPSQEGPAPFPITLSASGTPGAGTTVGGCGGIPTFTLTGPNGNDGNYAVSPDFTLPVNGTCVIDFTMDVNKTVANDADSSLSGPQTAFIVSANANDAVNNNPGSGLGSAEISFPDLTTTPGPGGTLGPDGVPPVNLSDAATIVGLLPDANNFPPTGTVTFKLYSPTDPTCTGAPFQAQTVDLSNPGECTITGATTTTGILNDGDTTIPVVTTAGLDPGPSTAFILDPVTFVGALVSYTSTDATNLLGVPAAGAGSVVGGPYAAGVQVNQTSADSLQVDCATTNTFTADAAGTWRWTAEYSGNLANQPVSSGCDEEPVDVGPATPLLTTVQIPETGTVLAQDLLDFANLQNGFFPTGTIDFTLYGPNADPLDKSCTNVIYTEGPFPVNGNGVYGPAIAPAALITQTGTYHWIAHYSGDANNAELTALCADEPVEIDKPVLEIVKTPDTTADAGGLITAGATATYTITLTNLGPGTALAVDLDDTLPGPLVWSFFSTTLGTCNPIAGNVLHCDVGDLPEGASVTVVVTAPTTKELCAAPPGLNAVFINNLNGGSIGSALNAATVTDPGKIECQTPKIEIVKTPDTAADVGGLITAGDTATFTITLTNLGPGTATAVAINDTLPGPLVWSFFSTSQGTCNPIVANALQCAIGDVPQGGSVTVVVTAPVSLADCEPAAGQASVKFINDTNGGAIGSASNAFEVKDPGTIECVKPKPQIAKAPDGQAITPGTDAEFTILVSNDASAVVDWKNVSVTDQLPAPGVGQSWTVSQQPAAPLAPCAVDAGNLLTCAGTVTLVPGDSRTIKVKTATTAADGGASFLNNTAFAGAPACSSNGTGGGGPGAYGIGSNADPVCDPGDITVEAPPCDLTIEKTCEVESTFTCAKPITALSMQWNGPGCVGLGGTAGANPSMQIDAVVCSGDVVTIGGYNGNQGNDVLWNICDGVSGAACEPGAPEFLGQSTFHLSCSDGDMNSADDCSLPEGDGKGSASCVAGSLPASANGCVNLWALAGISGPVGSPPASNLSCPGFGSTNGQTECNITPAPFQCTKPITALAMEWGGGLQIASISAKVSNNPGPDGTTVTYAPPGGINPGDLVSIAGYDGSLGNDVFWDITFADATTGQSTFHLSCSDSGMNSGASCNAPEGDGKGSVVCSPAPCVNDWLLKGITGPIGSPPEASLTCSASGPSASGPVTYHYKVTNNSPTVATGVKVQDIVTAGGVVNPPIDIICPSDTVAMGAPMTCTDVDQVGEDTTDQATVDANGCPIPAAISNVVSVTVGGGPAAQCPTAEPLTTKDRDVKWKITGGSVDLVISKIEISFPQATNGALTEVKLGKHKIATGSFSSVATITTFSGSAKDRTIDDGKREELKFRFPNKVASTPYDIAVSFANSMCVVHVVQ